MVHRDSGQVLDTFHAETLIEACGKHVGRVSPAGRTVVLLVAPGGRRYTVDQSTDIFLGGSDL